MRETRSKTATKRPERLHTKKDILKRSSARLREHETASCAADHFLEGQQHEFGICNFGSGTIGWESKLAGGARLAGIQQPKSLHEQLDAGLQGGKADMDWLEVVCNLKPAFKIVGREETGPKSLSQVLDEEFPDQTDIAIRLPVLMSPQNDPLSTAFPPGTSSSFGQAASADHVLDEIPSLFGDDENMDVPSTDAMGSSPFMDPAFIPDAAHASLFSQMHPDQQNAPSGCRQDLPVGRLHCRAHPKGLPYQHQYRDYLDEQWLSSSTIWSAVGGCSHPADPNALAAAFEQSSAAVNGIYTDSFRPSSVQSAIQLQNSSSMPGLGTPQPSGYIQSPAHASIQTLAYSHAPLASSWQPGGHGTSLGDAQLRYSQPGKPRVIQAASYIPDPSLVYQHMSNYHWRGGQLDICPENDGVEEFTA